METMFSSGMCRCCASEGTFKDLSSKYRWMGVDEVYSDMLRECFDLTLSMTEDCMEGGICEVCITQLRNAANFKKQVLTTEEQFKRMLQNKPFKSNIVKVEVNPPDDELRMTDEDNNMSADNFSDPEYEVPIKMESSDEGKSRKRPMRTSSRKKIKGEGESSGKRVVPIKKGLKAKSNLKIKRTRETISKIVAKPAKPEIVPLKPNLRRASKKEEMDKINSAIAIIQSSNILPFKTTSGFTCFYCDASFKAIEELEVHNNKEHYNPDAAIIERAFKKTRNSEELHKMNIVNLKCKLCNTPVKDFDHLKEHLSNYHGKAIVDDENIVPFRVANGEFHCALCGSEYSGIKALSQHMNVHYPNYVCEQCGVGFLLLSRLKAHKYSHLSYTYPCDICKRPFKTNHERERHKKYVHRQQKNNKCPHCPEMFNNYYARQQHIMTAHGVEIIQHKCSLCPAKFLVTGKLDVHMKRSHLGYRPHGCELCGKKYSMKSTLIDHVRSKHEGAKYQCDLCNKSYTGRQTLATHKRMVHRGNKIICDYCGKSFVLKISLENHIAKKHTGIDEAKVAAYNLIKSKSHDDYDDIDMDNLPDDGCVVLYVENE